ncbi:hypothetical protein EMIHUDRAFT_447824 [Emiliania huxleyi CCMP1516]|uniref:Uncharacterized protein n=2 Tax=Emiliania huxleyi TaxID=2903 RepID=A0A0D3JHX6_EMIH1|nr:hypothetical protein EMIHUDRAFT_447824 [Emiliania huxleyi CCMP1516]EOD23111.1 hypothetical protein EMIHUDRAFT_447824 [Emiliania huxleyi CCMP1516]|eukprot:XP_005775540.1 hypothetical protein EMIHUDRAFT_447824 [Emiliania huxleyi CCMP1516]
MRTLFGFLGRRTPDPPRRQQSGNTSTPEQPRRLRSSPRASSLSVVITEPPPQWEPAPSIGLTAYEALARLAGQIKEKKAGSMSALQTTASEACDEEEANRPPKGSTLSDDDDRASSPEDAARFTWTGEPRWTGPRADPFPSARAEVALLQRLIPGEVLVHENPSADKLSGLLRDCTQLHVACHMRRGSAVFVVTHEPIVLAAPASLERAVLNSLLHARVACPVFCWASRVEDEAARLFGEAAFEFGRFAVTADTKPTTARDGKPARSQKFTLRDPDAAATEAICEVGIRLVPAGVPELYDGTRFPFCLSFELPALASPDEDSDSLARAKMHLRGYLRRTCGLSSFRDSDLEIDRLTAVWRIALFERDGFEITRANGEPGESLVEELRQRYGATHADFELRAVRRGSVLLTIVGAPAAFDLVARDSGFARAGLGGTALNGPVRFVNESEPLTNRLGGMALKEPVRLLALHAQVYGSRVAHAALLCPRRKGEAEGALEGEEEGPTVVVPPLPPGLSSLGYAQQMERVSTAYDALVWQSTGEDLGVGFGEDPEEGLEDNASDRPPSPQSPAALASAAPSALPTASTIPVAAHRLPPLDAGQVESRAQHLAAARRRARWQAARAATRAVTDAAGVFNRLSRRSSAESAAGRASGRRSQEELPPRRSSGAGAQQGWRWRWE